MSSNGFARRIEASVSVSAWLSGYLVIVHCCAVLALTISDLNPWVRLAGLLGVAVSALYHRWWVCQDISVALGPTGKWQLKAAAGAWQPVDLVWAHAGWSWVTVLRFADGVGARRTVVLLADNCCTTSRRRLRVHLRWDSGCRTGP